MRVSCRVSFVEVYNESGSLVDGVVVRCSRCQHSAEAYGQSDRSVRRALIKLRETCPRDEHNWYDREGEHAMYGIESESEIDPCEANMTSPSWEQRALAAEAERDEATAAFAWLVLAVGGEARIAKSSLVTLKTPTLLREDEPEHVVFRALATKEPGHE